MSDQYIRRPGHPNYADPTRSANLKSIAAQRDRIIRQTPVFSAPSPEERHDPRSAQRTAFLDPDPVAARKARAGLNRDYGVIEYEDDLARPICDRCGFQSDTEHPLSAFLADGWFVPDYCEAADGWKTTEAIYCDDCASFLGVLR